MSVHARGQAIFDATHLPPMTLLSPLNIFVKLLTTTSANCNTLTFKKLPILSSTTIANLYLSASLRMLARSGDFRSGLPGNSQKRAMIFSPLSSCFSSCSSSSEEPWPRNVQPGPNFSKIFSVSMYGKLMMSVLVPAWKIFYYPTHNTHFSWTPSTTSFGEY